MLNTNVQQVLKELNSITNSGIITYPRTVLLSDAQDIMVDVNIQDLDSEEFDKIHLMDKLQDFLSLLGLFSDAEVDLTEKELNLKQGSKKSSFLFDNPVLMSAFERDSAQFDKTEEVPDVCSFELTVDDFKDISKASSVFKDLEELIIQGQDGDTNLILGNTNSFNARSNTYSITKEGTSSKEFEVKIPIQNFKKLPVSNYTFYVKYNEARDAYRILLKNNDIDLRIIMSVKV